MPKRWLLLNLSLLLLLLAGCAAEKPLAHNQNPTPELKNSIVLTIDLCPSSKPYEKKLFKTLSALGQQQGRPLPVAVAVSGGWIRKHRSELAAIKNMYLDITWVNHSLTHPVAGDFLDNPKVDFRREVLGNVELMKKNGLKPSRYFRFPGLRYDQERLKELKALGYTPLGASAWLGKEHWLFTRSVHDQIKSGSIVLIHGNGNERPGIVDEFLAWLKAHESEYQIVAVDRFRPAVSPSKKPSAVRP